MGNLAVIDITGLSPLANQAVFGGLSAFERCLDWARNVPEWSGTVLLASPAERLPEGAVIVDSAGGNAPAADIRAIVKDSWDEQTLIGALEEASSLSPAGTGEPTEALFFVRGDSPLLDAELTRILWDLHYRYDAEYTFADGYPAGLAPEVLGSRLPERLVPLARDRKGRIERHSLFEVLRQDINAFDVETHLSPEDLRMDRVSVTCDTKRNLEIAERLAAAGATDAASICERVPGLRDQLRSLPAYFPIQVTDHCPQACSYCPWAADSDPRQGTGHMDPARFADLCGNIIDFAGDAVFNLSMWGEPASHPQIGTLIRSALAAGERPDGPPVSRVIIETSGIGWDEALLADLAAEYPDGRLMWIVSLDAADPELYRRLRGDGLAAAEQTARTLTRLFGRHCWLQAVRMNENEEHLEDFYRKWKEEGAQVIVQKYDSFAGTLPQRQPADLSPLNRVPCWHLKRDMCVLLDGTVPVCRVDRQTETVLGNAFTDNLTDVWAKGNDLHLAHVNDSYPGVCGKCDEYYTFNF